MTIQEFNFSVDVLRALLWQHSNATRLESILQQKQDWITTNHTEFWNSWIEDVFDLRTANEFGLSVWAIILDLPLYFGNDAEDKPIWGFGSAHENFGNGNFAATPAGLVLTLEEKRLLLQLRYFQLVTRGTVPEINQNMARIFPDQTLIYVNDGGRMTARYVFSEALSPGLEEALTAFDLLPRPAAVKVDFVIDGEASGWGFGRYHVGFEQGNFDNA